MGLFDDLIPAGAGGAPAAGALPAAAGLFDDLIPAAPLEMGGQARLDAPRLQAFETPSIDTIDEPPPPDILTQDVRAGGAQAYGQSIPQAGADAVESGYLNLRMGMIGGGLGAVTGPMLDVMNRIDRGEPVPETEDVVGYQHMTPEQRAAFRQEAQAGVGRAVGKLGEMGREVAGIPIPPAMRAMSEAKTFGEGWDAFVSDPLGIIGFAGTQSLVTSAPSLALGYAGKIAGGLRGMMAGQGAGSFGVEFATSIMESLQEGGVDINDDISVSAAISDPSFMAGVRDRAATRAAAVGTFDAAAGRIAAIPFVRTPSVGMGLGSKAGDIASQFGVQAGLGAGGEALAQGLTGEWKPGEILLEGVAESFTTPIDLITARSGRRGAEAPAVDSLGQPTLPEIAPTAPAIPSAGAPIVSIEELEAIQRGERLPRPTPAAPGGIPAVGGVEPAPPAEVLPIGNMQTDPDFATEQPQPVEPALPDLPPVEPQVDPAPAQPAPTGSVSRETLTPGARVSVDFGGGETATGTIERVYEAEPGVQGFVFVGDDGTRADLRADDVQVTPEAQPEIPQIEGQNVSPPENGPGSPVEAIEAPSAPIVPEQPSEAIPASPGAPDDAVSPPTLPDIPAPGPNVVPIQGAAQLDAVEAMAPLDVQTKVEPTTGGDQAFGKFRAEASQDGVTVSAFGGNQSEAIQRAHRKLAGTLEHKRKAAERQEQGGPAPAEDVEAGPPTLPTTGGAGQSTGQTSNTPEAGSFPAEPAPQGGTPVASAPEQAPAPASAPSADTPTLTFTTAKGSTYQVFADGTTIRDKAARSEHPGDQGVKERSTLTVYIDHQSARALAPPDGGGSWRIIIHNDGTLSLATKHPHGGWGVAPSARRIPRLPGPEVGATPLELWRNGDETITPRDGGRGIPAYSKIHFGNPITSIEPVAPAAPAPATPEPKNPSPPVTQAGVPSERAIVHNAHDLAATIGKKPVVVAKTGVGLAIEETKTGWVVKVRHPADRDLPAHTTTLGGTAMSPWSREDAIARAVRESGLRSEADAPAPSPAAPAALPSSEQEPANARTEQVRADLPSAPEGAPAEDVRPPAGDGEPVSAPDRDGRAGGSDVRDRPGGVAGAEPRAEGLPGEGAASRPGTPDRERDGAERPDPAPDRGGPAEPADGGKPAVDGAPAEQPDERDPDDAAAAVVGENHRIENPGAIGRGGIVTKARQNIAAIKLLKKIEKEGRLATAEEQDTLAKYVGWGAIANAFYDRFGKVKSDWKDIADELRDLLTKEEYEAARLSTINAHYTSPEVIEAMWRGLAGLGFQGGRVLEPSMGVGHFFGLMPGETAARSTLHGVEMDNITGGIAKLLYPRADVRVAPFQDVTYPRDYFDVVIGNVPFANIQPHDPVFNRAKHSLHDYFFAKSLALTRPGGLVMMITSRYTMDKQVASFRKEIAETADLVGAIRLPNTAFKGNAGTEVVTDVLIFRRRAEGGAPTGPAWMTLTGVGPHDIPVNEYYAANPSQLLGTMDLTGSMYGKNEPTLSPDTSSPLGEQIDHAMIRISAQALLGGLTTAPVPVPASVSPTPGTEFAPAEVQEDAFYVVDGVLKQRKDGMAVDPVMAKTAVPKVRALVDIAGAARAALDAQRRDMGDEAIADTRKALNVLYDAFVKAYGPINKTTISQRPNPRDPDEPIVSRTLPNIRDFNEDPSYSLVMALEHYDEETGKATKADIFSKRVLDPSRGQIQIRVPEDALLASLTDKGRVDLDWIAATLGQTVDETRELLKGRIFENPLTGAWEDAERYLSGNVRTKLAQAQKAAKHEPRFKENVAALEGNQPEDLTPSQITASLGATWVPTDIIRQFARDVLEVDLSISLSEVDARWGIVRRGRLDDVPANAIDFGTNELRGDQLLDYALNGRTPKITEKQSDGTMITLQEETFRALEKLTKLKERFSAWIWEDAARAVPMARLYNDTMNNLRARKYDGAHLTFPGMAATVALRPHQKNAVWRVLQEGNTLFAHAVGAGKTMAMIAAAMESRRIGLARKPMVVVPNHMLEQFSREWLQLYPAAKLMVADKSQFHGDRRRGFVGRVATGDWDAVVITHSAFGRIPTSPEWQKAFIEEQINDYLDAIEAAKAAGEDKRPIKAIEKQLAAFEEKLKEMAAAEKKDRGLVFEELGVDMLIVDEAHFGKNLAFATRRQRIRGLPASASERAWDLFMKTRLIHRQSPGRGIIFATATPVTNTIAEIYTVQRYMQPDALRERGIAAFDAWASTFADVEVKVGVTAAGAGFEMQQRFSAFQNLPELQQMFRQFADVMTADDLKLPIPTLRTGKVQIVTSAPSDRQIEIAEELVERLDAVKKGRVKPDEDNALAITMDGRKAALDVRLLSPSEAEHPTGKLSEAIDRIYRIWKAGTPTKRTQIVFSDLGTPGEGKAFTVHDEIRDKLVGLGIPRAEIAFIHDANTDEKKARLFSNVRAGKVRVLIGTTDKMGVGTNVQKRLIAMHHIDAPWRPADIEQRDGRIMRQGNENPEVEIFRYVTERTFDAYMWQTLENKAVAITAFMRGDLTARTLEDIGEITIDYATAKALATGNPLLMERLGVEADLSRLRRRASQHRDDQLKVAFDARSLPEEIAADERFIESAGKDAKAAAKIPEKFTGSIGGKAFTDKAAFGEALKEKAITSPPGAAIGSYGPFTVTVFGERNKRQDDTVRVQIALQGEIAHTTEVDSALTGTGLTNRVIATAAGIGKRVEAAEESKARAEKQLRDVQARIGQPFADAKKLEETEARLARIDAQMAEMMKPRASIADAAPAAESSSGIAVTSTQISDGYFAHVEPTGLYLRLAPEWEARAQEVLDRTVGRGVGRAKVASTLTHTREDGTTQEFAGLAYPLDRLIYVALVASGPEAIEQVIRHEAFHILDTMDIWTEAERAALHRGVALGDWITDHIRKDYPVDEWAGEALAYKWQAWRRGTPTGIPAVDKLFNKLLKLFDAIRDMVRSSLGKDPDWRDLFSRIDRGKLADRATWFTRGVRDAGGKVEQVAREDHEAVRAMFRRAPTGPQVQVEERATGQDMNVLAKALMRPIDAVRRWPPLRRLVEGAIKAEQQMSQHINRLNRRFDEITRKLSTEEFESMGGILFREDAEEREISKAELMADGVTEKVANAVVAVRSLIEEIGRYVDFHRRSMLPKLQARKQVILRRMSSLRAMDNAEFRSLYGRRARLREKLRAGLGDPAAIATQLDAIEARLTDIRSELPAFMELLAESDRIEAQLTATSIRRREGYVPHKFFGTWRVFKKGPDDADGNPTWLHIAGEHGFFPSRSAAVKAAAAHAEATGIPADQMRVAPVEFKFPQSEATQLSDRAYGRFVGKVADSMGVSGSDLTDLIKDVATRRFRRRIAGFTQQRFGVAGFEKNIDRVLRTHIGEAVRYVQLDKLKYDAINTMEAMGLSPARRENQETKVLQEFANNFLRDVMGQKQPTERMVDQYLDKLEGTPAAAPLAVGAAITAVVGIAGSPYIAPFLGGYIGYRLYRAIASGGSFKSRALTGSMLTDMSHLKLGAFFNVFSAVVNLSQTMIATYPKLGEKWTTIGMTKAMAALTAAKLGKDTADTRLLQRADIDTRFSYSEASPHLFQKQATAARWSMAMFTGAEHINRATAFLGAYYRAIDRGASPAEAMAQGKATVTATQFHYGSAGKPELLRNVFLRVPGQFKNFLVQMFSFLFGLRGAEIPRFILALMLVAGLFGMPGWEWLDWALEGMTGFSLTRYLVRQGLELQIDGGASGTILDTLSRGFPALFGLDLSRRTGLGDSLPKDMRDLKGPWWSTAEGALRLGARNATMVDHLRNLSPGLGNPLKALEAAADGIPLEKALWRVSGAADATGWDQGPHGFGNDRASLTSPWRRGWVDYEPTTGELALKAAGGMPLRESKITGYERIRVKETEKVRTGERKYIDQIIASLQEHGNNEKADGFLVKMNAILKRATEAKVEISKGQVQTAIRNAKLDRGERGIKSVPQEIRTDMDRLRRSAYGEKVQPEAK